MDHIRIGLVGFGRFGKLHADAIQSIEGAELSRICVGHTETAAELRKRMDAEVFTDYERFLQGDNLDLVDIVSPNYLHADQAARAMNRGLDLLIEKPIAIDIDQAQKLVETRKKTKATVQVGFEYRYAPFWRAFKSALEKKQILHPTFCIIKSWRRPLRQGSAGWRYDQRRVGHQLLEEAIHYFDIALWDFGLPESVSGFTDSPLTWKRGEFGESVSILHYANGLVVMIEDCLNGISDHITMTVSGAGAMIGMTQSESTSSARTWVKLRDRDGTITDSRPRSLTEKANIMIELEDLLRVVRKGGQPAVSLDDGFKALAVCQAAIKSIGRGKAVRLPKAVPA